MFRHVLIAFAMTLFAGCATQEPETDSETQDVTTHDVGVDWVKRMKTTFGDLSAQSPSLKTAAMGLAFSTPGTQASRTASAALNQRLGNVVSTLGRVLQDFDLVLEEGIVLGTAHGTLRISEGPQATADGRTIPGIRDVRTKIATAN